MARRTEEVEERDAVDDEVVEPPLRPAAATRSDALDQRQG